MNSWNSDNPKKLLQLLHPGQCHGTYEGGEFAQKGTPFQKNSQKHSNS